MEKIYYNQDGWVCDRHPNNFPIENERLYLEADDEEAEKTYVTRLGYAWRVVDGALVNEVYDSAVVQQQETVSEIEEITRWFDEVYDMQIKQAERCKRLGIPYDNKYGTVDELDAAAVGKSARLSELRDSL